MLIRKRFTLFRNVLYKKMWEKNATFTGTLFVDLFYKRLQGKIFQRNFMNIFIGIARRGIFLSESIISFVICTVSYFFYFSYEGNILNEYNLP